MKETNATPLSGMNDVQQIASRILDDDTDYINRLTREAANWQTWFASIIVQAVRDLEPELGEKLLSLYLIVWDFYRCFPSCRETAVTQQQFERMQQHNISMFRYLDHEEDNGLFSEIVSTDHQKLHHEFLMQYISHCFRTWPSLTGMEANDYCVQLITIKSFVECFEENL